MKSKGERNIRAIGLTMMFIGMKVIETNISGGLSMFILGLGAYYLAHLEET